MPKSLVVVESPAKAKTINKYLGKDYKVVASVGHIRDLPKSKLGVDVDDGFAPAYEPIPARKKVIKELRAAAKGASDIYVATDPDREGEAIGWHLAAELAGKKRKIHRLTFNEITKKAILGGARASGRHRSAHGRRASRRGACSIGSSATSSVRCCGTRCAGASALAASSRWRSA